jgi:Family of unknown function (DUF6174)
MPASDSAAGANSHPPAADSAAPSSPPRGKRLPGVLMAGLILAVVIAGVVVALQLFAVRRIPELTEPLLEAAEERWQANGPASYNLDLEITGAQPGIVHVEVRDGEVTAMTRDGRAPDQRRTWAVWSVPGQFDTIERELELAEDPVHEMQASADTRLKLRAEFDPHYGYPRQYQRMVFGGGPEVYWQVTKFEPQ